MRRSPAPFAGLLLFALLVSCAVAPPQPLIVSQNAVRPVDACAYFRPIYITPQEVQALSRSTLGAIIANNDEGKRRCGWKTLPAGKQ